MRFPRYSHRKRWSAPPIIWHETAGGSRKNTVDTSRPYDWYGFTISSMLAKPEYMGHTVNFRSSKKSYRDKRVKNDPSDWLILRTPTRPSLTRKPGSWPSR